ncbi:MAG: tetratricopeptide repeat protein [Elusimicrobiota bacterium]
MDPITDKEDCYYYRGKLYFESGDYQRALKELQKGLQINSSSVMILYEIGMCWLKLGKWRKAVLCVRKIRDIAPHSTAAQWGKEIEAACEKRPSDDCNNLNKSKKVIYEENI